MRASSSSLLRFSRWSWFALIAAAFGAKDMCAGGGHPPDPDPPADAAPSDASKDGAMSRRELSRDQMLAARATTTRAARD